MFFGQDILFFHLEMLACPLFWNPGYVVTNDVTHARYSSIVFMFNQYSILLLTT